MKIELSVTLKPFTFSVSVQHWTLMILPGRVRSGAKCFYWDPKNQCLGFGPLFISRSLHNSICFSHQGTQWHKTSQYGGLEMKICQTNNLYTAVVCGHIKQKIVASGTFESVLLALQKKFGERVVLMDNGEWYWTIEQYMQQNRVGHIKI